jgi:hypothetical protein
LVIGKETFEGFKGGGTWDSYTLAPGIYCVELEDEMDLPTQ